MATRILLVDDHRVVLDGLDSLLNLEADLEVVGMAEDGRAALTSIAEHRPDIVIIDISMPGLNGQDAAAQVRHDYPKIKIIALSTHTDGKHVRGMLDAGTDAYVTKETVAAELLQAIRAVRRGRKYLSSDITDTVVDGYVKREIVDTTAMQLLSGREREVLQLIAEGLTSGEVANELHISTNTVDTHRRNVMKKLDVHTVAGLTKYAIREGLTDLQH